MTEIPEHLLKRSKQRRAAIGGEDAPADGPAEAAASAGPADTAPAVPAPAAAPATPAPAPAPEPVRPEVAAYQRRRKIPFWAMPVLAGLPLWAYVYQSTLEPPPAADDDPVVLGEALYASCASCHGSGGGGVGNFPALTGVLETWPDYRDHMMWVRLGSAGWPADTYGAPEKTKNGGMPAFDLSDEELAQVVLYERVAFGGLEPGSEEYMALEAVAAGEATFEESGLGELSASSGVDEANLAAG